MFKEEAERFSWLEDFHFLLRLNIFVWHQNGN